MRKLAVATFVSLDGVMQAPGGPEEDRSGGFALGGWSVPYWDDGMSHAMDEASRRPFELLLGRGTYELFAAHWPHVSGDAMGDVLNRIPKYVASTTLTRAEWNNTGVIAGDVAHAVAALKQQPGDELQVHGSWGLVQTLLEHELVDEFRLWVFPLVLGTGKRLFGRGAAPAGLRLASSTTSTTGVTIATYERAGEITPGSFALDEPSAAEIERRRRETVQPI